LTNWKLRAFGQFRSVFGGTTETIEKHHGLDAYVINSYGAVKCHWLGPGSFRFRIIINL